MTWISVDDRLPAHEKPVVVLTKGMGQWASFATMTQNGRWLLRLDEFSYEPWMLGYKVTHWMPLPDPPPNCSAQNLPT